MSETSKAAGAVSESTSVVHVADEQAHASERSIQRVAEISANKGLPIRMRMLIQLWDYQQYVAWRGQTWRVETQDAAGAMQIRQALEEFFDLLAVRGPEWMILTLQTLKQFRVPSPADFEAMILQLEHPADTAAEPVTGQETNSDRPVSYTEPSE